MKKLIALCALLICSQSSHAMNALKEKQKDVARVNFLNDRFQKANVGHEKDNWLAAYGEVVNTIAPHCLRKSKEPGADIRDIQKTLEAAKAKALAYATDKTPKNQIEALTALALDEESRVIAQSIITAKLEESKARIEQQREALEKELELEKKRFEKAKKQKTERQQEEKEAEKEVKAKKEGKKGVTFAETATLREFEKETSAIELSNLTPLQEFQAIEADLDGLSEDIIMNLLNTWAIFNMQSLVTVTVDEKKAIYSAHQNLAAILVNWLYIEKMDVEELRQAFLKLKEKTKTKTNNKSEEEIIQRLNGKFTKWADKSINKEIAFAAEAVYRALLSDTPKTFLTNEYYKSIYDNFNRATNEMGSTGAAANKKYKPILKKNKTIKSTIDFKQSYEESKERISSYFGPGISYNEALTAGKNILELTGRIFKKINAVEIPLMEESLKDVRLTKHPLAERIDILKDSLNTIDETFLVPKYIADTKMVIDLIRPYAKNKADNDIKADLSKILDEATRKRCEKALQPK